MSEPVNFWDDEEPAEVRPGWLYDWFSDRKIGARVVDALGITAGARRTIIYCAAPSGTLFNASALAEKPAHVVWAASELDVAAILECGVETVVSVHGADPQTALKVHADGLQGCKKVVLCAPPGEAREELARRLGRHRCWLVAWPEGCKDACEVLVRHGPDAITSALRAAEPYPIEGLQRIRQGTLKGLRRLPPPTTMTTGARATDAILKLPTEGRLIITTGYPGSGKTSWVRFVMIHTAANHNRRWVVFSPEMQPWEQFAAECAEVWSGKSFWPIPGLQSMDDAEIEDAETWLGDKVTMIVADAIEDAPTIDWIMERASAAVLRDGATDLWIDPWNQVDHSRNPGITETEYIGRQLQRLASFGLRYGVNVWVNVHPTKPQMNKEGGSSSAPGPYDINGSAHWFNRADIGITVHSPGPDRAEVHLWKARFVRRWGKKGGSAPLDFDPLVGRYSTPTQTDHYGGAPRNYHEVDDA